MFPRRLLFWYSYMCGPGGRLGPALPGLGSLDLEASYTDPSPLPERLLPGRPARPNQAWRRFEMGPP